MLQIFAGLGFVSICPILHLCCRVDDVWASGSEFEAEGEGQRKVGRPELIDQLVARTDL